MAQFTCLSVVMVAVFLLSACGSSAEWVHPTKPKEMFAQDYNQCESRQLNDPKLQQGNRYFLTQATERCLMKDGWILREKR
jgi:hypothetical protein